MQSSSHLSTFRVETPIGTALREAVLAKKASLFVLLVLLCAPTAFPQTTALSHGKLRIEFHDASGRPARLVYGGRVVGEWLPEAAPASFAIGPRDKIQWIDDLKLPRTLAGIKKPGPGLLEVTARYGDYELVEKYRLHSDRARLDRSAVLTNRGRETVKLRNLVFSTPVKAVAGGFYRAPGRWPPQSRDLGQLAAGASTSYAGRDLQTQHGGAMPTRTGGSIAPMAVQITPKLSAIWLTASDDGPGGHDGPGVGVVEHTGGITVRQEIRAMGYLRPGQPQEIGFASLILVEQDYWGALASIQKWHESVGIRLPADQPDWIRGAIFYSFHPGGTIGSNWRDLGGFRAASERLVPSLSRLGVSAVWILPVEFRSPYWPLDYYRFMDGLGTGEEYRELVSRLHKAGLYVLQDLVPHGGAPSAVHNQQNPKFMLHREDGSTLTYWLNDFARTDWQDFIAKVTAHYMREYDLDGYRVDACYGSKEPNWDPDLPYARASMAGLWGGLRMLDRIRNTIRELKPKEGALLAEVQSARHWPFSDAEFDFDFGRVVCQQWRREQPSDYVAHLQEYFEEQRLVEPRGANWLRHTESHDMLRSQLWWGVEGMRTMYALSAWIDGSPMIYQEMERGNAFQLRRINEIRRARPELSRGEAYYRAVKCDTPGVFTCLRKSGGRQSVVVINFNRDPVRAKLDWPGGEGEVTLAPLGYTVVPEPPAEAAPVAAPTNAPKPVSIADGLAFPGAAEWFVDTVEGRLADAFVALRGTVKPARAAIYWRTQGTADLWLNETHPLDPANPQIGVRNRNGGWAVLRLQSGQSQTLRLAEQHDGKRGLFLLGLGGMKYELSRPASAPPARDVRQDTALGGVKLRVVGPDYIVSNRHFIVVLRRQGGVVREVRRGDRILALDQDLVGEKPFLLAQGQQTRAGHDVESGISVSPEGGGLRLVFEGQLRGFGRFSIRKPPIWYRNELVFTDAPRFQQTWSFKADEGFKSQAARLGAVLVTPSAVAQAIPAGAAGIPRSLVLEQDGKRQFSLEQVRGPESASATIEGNRIWLTLLDGDAISMGGSRWYDFSAVWNLEE